jgi:SsrA-binding protein
MTATRPSESRGEDRLIAQNRRASHDYAILETIEAGLVLAGTEVKSLRVGKASLAESWASIDDGEVWVRQLHIPPYEQGNRWNLDPVRARKLLLHREEIAKLQKAVAQKGQTLIPLKLYFARGRAKLLLGIAKGKKTHDKREAIAERDAKREIDRARRRGERDG